MAKSAARRVSNLHLQEQVSTAEAAGKALPDHAGMQLSIGAVWIKLA